MIRGVGLPVWQRGRMFFIIWDVRERHTKQRLFPRKKDIIISKKKAKRDPTRSKI